MELDGAIISHSRSGSLTMHINKVSHVKTISLVAKELGENEEWLFDISVERGPEDGAICVCGIGDEGLMALTDSGAESIVDPIKKCTKASRRCSSVSPTSPDIDAVYAG